MTTSGVGMGKEFCFYPYTLFLRPEFKFLFWTGLKRAIII